MSVEAQAQELLSVTVTVPMKTVSETNQREHWTVRHRRRRIQRHTVMTHLLALGARWTHFPCVVTLTRIASRKLDPDNMVGSMKATIDSLATWMGIDDADERVTWRFEQENKRRGELQAVRIEVIA